MGSDEIINRFTGLSRNNVSYLASAFFLISGVRGMERGTISSVRDANGNDVLADIELLRLAMPRRVFTLRSLSSTAVPWTDPRSSKAARMGATRVSQP